MDHRTNSNYTNYSPVRSYKLSTTVTHFSLIILISKLCINSRGFAWKDTKFRSSVFKSFYNYHSIVRSLLRRSLPNKVSKTDIYAISEPIIQKSRKIRRKNVFFFANKYVFQIVTETHCDICNTRLCRWELSFNTDLMPPIHRGTIKQTIKPIGWLAERAANSPTDTPLRAE